MKQAKSRAEVKRQGVALLVLGVLLVASLAGNIVLLFGRQTEMLYEEGANSRATYFTVHNLREAQALGRGAGVKVGVIDAYFAMDAYPQLYAGGQDFSGKPAALAQERSHGWQMATVLREIAPECEIYALCLSRENEERMVDSIIAAIEWAQENGIGVLTLSQGQISEKNRQRLDAAVDKAVAQGIVTCFIHYDNPNNLLPYSTTPYGGDYGREPDINVYHYDYNTVWVSQLRSFLNRKNPPESGDDVPYFSYSSMSPVAAGFVAVLRGIDPTLTPNAVKRLLVETSYRMDYVGVMDWETGPSEHTVDLYRAALAASERAS